MEKSIYSPEFFKTLKDSSLESARQVVPIILELVNPKSVVDVGCGVGAWLYVFQERNVKDILGIDGCYLNKKSLLISQEKFLARDLKKPFNINKKFDLALCLEVAEHIPKEYSGNLIDSLTALSKVIVFSAAIPFQGGTYHVNEQWPEYWKRLFEKKGYVLIDCIRKKIWNNLQVDYFYAQNMFFFVEKESLDKLGKLKTELRNNSLMPLNIVHPNRYLMISKDRALMTKWIPNFIKKMIHRH